MPISIFPAFYLKSFDRKMSHCCVKCFFRELLNFSAPFVTRRAKRKKKYVPSHPRPALLVMAVMHLQRALFIPAVAASEPIALHDAKPLLLPPRVA